MHLRKRKDGTFQAIYYDRDGRRKFKSTHCTDRRAAKAAGLRFERQAQDPDNAAENETSFGEALDDMITHIEKEVAAGRKSPGTLNMHRVKAGHIKRVFEAKDLPGGDVEIVPFRLASLSAHHIDAFIDTRRAEGAKETTIAKELVTARVALKRAKRGGKWAGDVAAVLPIAFAPEYSPVERWLPEAELMKLLENLTPDHAARAAYTVATSANWAETTRARRDDDSQFGVRVHGTKRTSRRRIVPIVTSWQRSLLAYAHEHGRGKDGLLFNSAYEAFHNALQRACVDAEIPSCTSNDLRRTFCQWMRASGVPAELVAPAMGHADTKMVERIYGRMPPEVLASRIAQAIGTPVAQTSAHQMDSSDSADNVSREKSNDINAGDGTRTRMTFRSEDFKSSAKQLPSPRDYKRNRSYEGASGTPVAQRQAAAGVVIVLPRAKKGGVA